VSDETPSRRSSGGFSAPRGSGANKTPPAVKKGYAGMRTSGANPSPTASHGSQSVDDAARAVLSKMGGAKSATASGKVRRKFKASDVTPRQRLTMILGAAGCVVVAGIFTVFNPLKEQSEEAQAVAEMAQNKENADPAPKADSAEGDSAPAAPPPHKTQYTPHATQSRTTIAAPAMPPFSNAIRLVSSEMPEQLKVIKTYLFEGTTQDKADAYRALKDLGDELKTRLPDLIREEDKIPLAAYANAARELKVAAAVDPVIAKLSTDNPTARFELFQMLAASDSPKAHDFIWTILNRGDGPDNGIIWKSLGNYMTDKDADSALKIASSFRNDAGDAADALGVYASKPAEATRLSHQIDELMRKTDVNRAALMRTMTSMEPGASSFALLGYTTDTDEKLRAAALGALARDKSRYYMSLNALRTDSSLLVKSECIRGFMQNQNDEVLAECIKLLKDPILNAVAHEALVNANKKKDLGWHDFAWIGWLAARKNAKAGKS
jgi:hypothetical protein